MRKNCWEQKTDSKLNLKTRVKDLFKKAGCTPCMDLLKMFSNPDLASVLWHGCATHAD